jgi:putative transposase
VTPPRYCEKGQTYFITVQAVGRGLRFVPTRQVRESIEFLLARYATRHGLQVHEYSFLSNHYHMAATDPEGSLSDFMRNFHSMLSRQLNAIRGTTGSNFEKRPSIQVIVDGGGVVDKSVYTLVNPLAADLVARLRDWKASSSLGLEYGREVTFSRPRCGLWAETKSKAQAGKHPSRGRLRYRGRSSAPETAVLKLVRPDVPQERADQELRTHIRARVAECEQELVDERRRTKTKVLGWVGVVSQSYLAVPASSRVLFDRQPRVTGRDRGACAAVLGKLDRFVAAYRRALADFHGGGWPTFPYGTLQMARRYGVKCATAPP